MINFNEGTTEIDRFQYGSFRNLMVQDAIIIIVIYAAQLDLSISEEEIKRVEGIAEGCPACVEKKKGIFSRINRFVNEMRNIEREKVLEIAMEILTPELRKTAFELAAEVIMTGNELPDQKSKILEKLVTKMSIEIQFAAKVI
ncbi:MAG: hypothetical protein HOD17_07640, partial [Desulfobacteraceae bacterium]|nr:hypothetical protein [Desulfobacteraceae bacterium]